MELRLYVGDEPLIFVEPLTAPAVAPNARAWLTKVSGLSLAARALASASSFTSENASVTVEIDNRERQASELLGQPLRVYAEIYDSAALYFSGIVQSLDYGTSLGMTLEA